MAAILVNEIDISSIESIPSGIVVDGPFIWFCGLNTRHLYKTDRAGNLISDIDLSGIPAQFGCLSITEKYIIITSTYLNSKINIFDRKGNLIRQKDFSAIDIRPRSIIRNSKNYYLIGETNKMIYQLDNNFTIIRSFTIQPYGTSFRGISFNKKNLIIVSNSNKIIYLINNNGTKINEMDISLIDTEPMDIYFDGLYVWLIGAGADKIYQLLWG